MTTSEQSSVEVIAIAASFTTEPLLQLLYFVIEQAGLRLDVRLAPYHQVFQELLSPTSLLATNAGGVDVVLVRLEDFVREIQSDDEALSSLRRAANELTNALVQFAQRVKVPTLLAVMPPSPSLPKTLLAEIQAANTTLATDVRSLPGLTLLSAADLDMVSAGERYDSVTDELAHLPFTEAQYGSIALAIVRKVHAMRTPAHKVLVLDCDETLWHGVVGEDGVDGLRITSGRERLQQFAVKMQAEGTLICLVSKNAEHDVLEVFEKRSDMTLKLEHLVAHRINWEPKPRNLASLAQVLNVGLDAFVFIDDNPVECALMRAELPQVVTLQLPPDDEIESFLAHLWVFDKASITEEDSRRTSMYRENAARRELEEATTDIAQFIASLGLVIDVAVVQESEWRRVAQLTQRTNQFTFTTLRRAEAELRVLASSGSTILRVKVRDRFGDYGIVGLVITDRIADRLCVDTLLLSCRVLGRGVEHAILRQLGERAKQLALDSVELRYAPTAKNEPAHAFAESVAAEYRIEEPGRTLYRIPTECARAIVHTPGHDPVAVMEARKSEENKDSARSMVSDDAGLSERYARLAHAFVSGRSVLQAMRAGVVRTRNLSRPPVVAGTYMERELLELWQGLLGLEGLGAEDDYLALGGTSLIAVRMIAEIRRRFGVQLPLTVVLEAPTVRALSRHLQDWRNPRSEVLVELKSGGPRNLFLVHDGNGETLLYLNLARRMPDDLAVFGIEPRRVARVPLAHTTIEQMAAFYLEQVHKKQPHGPYLLGGMCAGGVIAYEMASQLVRAGEEVGLVALLDAARPKALMKPWHMLTSRTARLKQALTQTRSNEFGSLKRTGLVILRISQKIFNTALCEFSERRKSWFLQARFRLLREVLRHGLVWPKFLAELTAFQIYNSAEARYSAKPLSLSSVLLVRAQTGKGNDTPFRDIYVDETFGWAAVTHCLTVLDVDGGHSTMLQERFVDSLAVALMPYLRQKPLPIPANSSEAKIEERYVSSEDWVS
jgi:FkbH-like protein